MKRIHRAMLVAALLLAHGVAWADESGRIVGVFDGDTVDLVTESKVLIRVRLAGIDAPESKQAFAYLARRVLSYLTFDQAAPVVGGKKDSLGRLVGKVLVHGNDVNLKLVQMGLAWHFRRYGLEQAPEDRRRYAEAELSTRAQRIGIRAPPDPVPPWEFRAARKAAAPAASATR